MIGMVLAAGAGRRLRPYTDTVPKALIPVADDTAILDISLHNLAAVGLTEVVVVVGYAAEAIEQRVEQLQQRHGVRLTLVANDKAEIWNNAYSMWVAREQMQDGVLMVNGDTVHPASVEEALLASRGPEIVLAVDREKTLGEEEMKVLLDGDGYLTRITKLMDPRSAHGEYIGACLIEATCVPALAAALQTTFERDPDLYYEDGYQEFVDRGGRIGTTPIPSGTSWVEVDDHRDLELARKIACLLARMLPSPLFVDIRPGAVADLATLLDQRKISGDGTVLVAVGPGRGEQIWASLEPQLPKADRFVVRGASLAAAGELQGAIGSRGYDAVVAVGGGKTLDVAKYAATRAALPMVAVATSLAHDGICSPVASLEHPHGKGSFGVAMPIGVVVDLEHVRAAPPELVRAGIGDVISNLSAIEDWRLAEREHGETVDGLAIAFARTGAEAILHRDDGIESDDFLTTLAEALVLSGMAMAVAGTSRPCSGACHEIIHAIDSLYPQTASHGELAGVGALFAYFLREDELTFELIARRLAQHDLPRTPADLGLSDEQFVTAVWAAPATRPDRYTILEHLALDKAAIRDRTKSFVERLS